MSDYFVGADCAAVMYLEDPASTCERERRYLHVTASPMEAAQASEDITSSQKRLCMGSFITLKCEDRETISGSVTVSFSVSFYVRGVLRRVTISSQTVPYTDAIGYSATDVPDTFIGLSTDMTLIVRVVNDTNQSISVEYLTMGPLQFFKGGSSLSDYDFGSRLGDDDKTITFGLCRDFGSLKVKDNNKMLLGLLDNPEHYLLEPDVSHYPMRVEFFLGGLLYGVFEVERFDYDDGSHLLTVNLQSPFDELDKVLVEPLYYTEKMTLADFLSKSVSYAEEMGHGTLLGMFDFSSICGATTASPNCLGRVRLTPLIEDSHLDMAQVLEWVSQAAALNLTIYPSISVDMHYRFLMVPWFGGATRIATYGSSHCADFTSTDLLGNPTFTPLKDNYVDKVTYESHRLSMSADERTVTETFPITTMHGGETQADFKLFWTALSGMGGTDDLNVHDSWYGHRTDSEGRGPKRAELFYDTAKQLVHTNYRNIRYMMAKASTRSLLYRFRFNLNFNGASSTTVGQKWQSVVDEASYIPSTENIPSDLPSTESTRLSKLLSRRSAFLPGARWNTAIEMPYEENTVYDGRFWQHGNAFCPGGKYTIPEIFSNFHTLYSLRLSLPAETRLVAGEPISISIKVNYWYTRIFGGWNDATLESSRWSQRYATGAKREPGETNFRSDPNGYTLNRFTDGMTEMADYFCVQFVNDQKQVEDEGVSCTFAWDGNFYVPQRNGSNLSFYECFLWTMHDLASNGRWSKSGNFAHWYEKTSQQSSGYYRYNRVACPPRVFDDQDASHSTGVFGKARYYHTGDDSGACGHPILVKEATLGLSDVQVSNGVLSLPVALPSSSAAVTKIRETNKTNIFGTETGANAYCCYVNPPYHYSFLNTNGTPDPLGSFLNANMSFDKPIRDTNDLDNADSPNYFPSNPVYGYIIKDVVATVTYTPYTVENVGEVVKQYNEFGRFNYNLQTNVLMVDEGDYKEETYVVNLGWVNTVEWLVEAISNFFANGRHTATIKSRLKYFAGTYNKLPMVGDSINNVSVSKNGAQAPLVQGVEWRVKSVEYVYEGGSSYCVLGLIEY